MIGVTILETLGLFVGAPLAIYGLIAVLSLLPGRAKRHPRYRPGQSWDFAPQWWAGDTPVALDAGVSGTAKGGARGSW